MASVREQSVFSNAIREFLRLESAGSLLLLGAAVLAMVIENSPASGLYDRLLQTLLRIQIGELDIAKPLLLWINDGLMAIFFFLVGLELKREILKGELSDPSRLALPMAAAAGGVLLPAGIFILLNRQDGVALNGWAIPTATDIAFALGVLSVFGRAVPVQLKLFLLTLAIIDDIVAIVVIAIFYSNQLTLTAFAAAGGFLIVLFIMNRRGVSSVAAYLLVGVLLWVSVLKSGVHATLAGVLLAWFIPLRTGNGNEPSPLRRLEHDLHPAVAYGVLPLFAFANAGVPLAGLSLSSLAAPVPLGISLGLFLGKQIGVFGAAWLMVKARLAPLPDGLTWRQIYGVSLLCGIGFTMSLFIGSLAYEQVSQDYAGPVRIGILLGSLVSAAAGYLVLRPVLRAPAAEAAMP